MIFPASATRFIRRAFTERRDSSRAVNALASGEKLAPANYGPLIVHEGALAIAPPIDLRRWLLPAALVGLMIDALVSIWLMGGAPMRRRGALAALAHRRRAWPRRGPTPGPSRRIAADLRSRHGCGLVDPARLCRDRRRVGRRNLEARIDGADAGARFPHFGRARRAGRSSIRPATNSLFTRSSIGRSSPGCRNPSPRLARASPRS